MTMPIDRKTHESHPLYPVFIDAIEQVLFGKGERHGGEATPFLGQPWSHYAKLHGRGSSPAKPLRSWKKPPPLAMATIIV